MTSIRPAQTSDAAGIAVVQVKVWPDEHADIQRIANVIEDTDHMTHVAEKDGHIVGFVDGFITRSEAGRLRWEVDLLAVHPDFQQRGIAKRMIRASGQSGREFGVILSRTLIHVDNRGSMKAFAGCGYHVQGEQCGLFISSSDNPLLQQETEANSYLVSVRTMKYYGLWVEGKLSEAGFKVANAVRVQHNLDLAGVVIPGREAAAVRAACSTGYQYIGQYQYWTTDICDPWSLAL